MGGGRGSFESMYADWRVIKARVYVQGGESKFPEILPTYYVNGSLELYILLYLCIYAGTQEGGRGNICPSCLSVGGRGRKSALFKCSDLFSNC